MGFLDAFILRSIVLFTMLVLLHINSMYVAGEVTKFYSSNGEKSETSIDRNKLYQRTLSSSILHFNNAVERMPVLTFLSIPQCSIKHTRHHNTSSKIYPAACYQPPISYRIDQTAQRIFFRSPAVSISGAHT